MHVTVQKVYSRDVNIPVESEEEACEYVENHWREFGLDGEGVAFSIFLLADDGREAYITEGVE